MPGLQRAVRRGCIAVLLVAASAAQGRELVIGQSLGLTGGGAQVAKQYLEGAKCHFDLANGEGGVRGNTLKLVALDDGGQRERTLDNTRKLIEVEKAFALFGYTAAAGAQAAFPMIEERGIPLVGIASGGLGVHDRLRRPVFHVRASYTAELDGIVRLLGSTGIAPAGGFAFVYNQDAKPNLGAFEEVAKRNAVAIAGSVGIDRNSADMREPVKQLLATKPGVIVAITTSKAMAAFIKEARRQGYTGVLVSSSFAGDPLVAESGKEGVGVIVAQVVPDPRAKTTGVVRDYHAALAKCGAKSAPSASGLEGYISARVLAEGLRRAGSGVTRDSLITALESIRKLDLGGIEINFSPASHEGTSFVELLIIAKDGRLKK